MSFGNDGGDYGYKEYNSKFNAASDKIAGVADDARGFADDFFAKYISPQLDAMASETTKATKRNDELYDLQVRNAKLADQRYRTQGIPAMDRVYQKANEFSAADEEERQAGLALGDVRDAETVANAQRDRALTARGIDPSSPAALAAANNSAVMATVAKAAAQNKARMAAKEMGWKVAWDAANFGRGELQPVAGFSADAGNTARTGPALRSAAIDAGNRGATVPMSGYDTALRGYGQNASSYGSMTGQALNAKAKGDQAEQEGWGNFIGTLAGTAFKAYTGSIFPPAAAAGGSLK